MAGDPADVSGAPVDVLLVVVEHVAEGGGGVQQVTGGGVQHAFWFAGRTTVRTLSLSI